MNLFPNLVPSLDQSVASHLPQQVMDTSRPDFGGWFSPNLGFASPSHIGNASFIMRLVFAYATDESAYFNSPEILERIVLAAEFQIKCRRASGLYDIPFTNFDSPSDTGFSLSQVGRALWMARNNPKVDSAPLDDALEPFLVPAAKAAAADGFHTPNHRWVRTGALAQVAELFPGLGLEPAIEAYLAETIDVNEDGQYSERSNGGYNAVCNSHLIQTAEALGRPEILESVRRNLQFMQHLLHADGSVVTINSRRQDQGQRRIPANAADGFFYMGMHDQNPELLATAVDLVQNAAQENHTILYWLARHPEWRSADLAPGNPPANYAKHFAASGLWRVRRGKMSATASTEVATPFQLVYGNATLAGVRLHSPYFAGARFTGRTMSVDGATAAIELKSDFLLPQLPGYWKPLGRPVPYEDLPYFKLEDREVLRRPEFTFHLEVTEVEGGFDLHVTTEGGMEQVTFLLDFFFRAPGEIETEQASFPASADGSLLLRSGQLTYRVGEDAITIGPGFAGHRIVGQRQIESPEGLFRVTMTDWTQVDRVVKIRCHRWSEAEGPYLNGGGPVHLEGK